MKTNKLYFVSCFPAFLILISSSLADPIVIGSKKFTESYVLGEIAKRTLNDAGIPAEHRQGMGGTIIVWQALRGAQIDAYPEYTGTIAEEILKDRQLHSAAAIREALSNFGVGMTEPLGFNNTYALIMRRDRAQELGIRTISDLQKHPELKIGLTHEFLARQDGWQPLAARYRLNPQSVIGIDHALGYAALQNGSIDVKDAYSTDAKIAEYDLVVLEDDVGFFPKYEAVFLFRASMRKDAIAALRKLGGTLDEARMIQLNAEAERTKNYTRAANLYFRDDVESATSAGEPFSHKLARWTVRHLQLAGFSLLLAIVVGIPLGIFASRGGVVGHAILGFASIVQTIPSLALLALLVPIPFFGISARSAVRCGCRTRKLVSSANRNRWRHFPGFIVAACREKSPESASYRAMITACLLGKYRYSSPTLTCASLAISRSVVASYPRSPIIRIAVSYRRSRAAAPCAD